VQQVAQVKKTAYVIFYNTMRGSYISMTREGEFCGIKKQKGL
jgi:hypothetical protein